MEEKDYLTQEKYDEFVKELEYLKKEKRKEVAESLEHAKSLGDLSENAEYHEARDEQANVEDRIAKLEAILKTAEIVSSDHQTNQVGIGSEVTLKKVGAKDAVTYTIVGSEESDIASGKVSIRSPLGQAVSGKGKGEEFSFNTPGGATKYKVVDIK